MSITVLSYGKPVNYNLSCQTSLCHRLSVNSKINDGSQITKCIIKYNLTILNKYLLITFKQFIFSFQTNIYKIPDVSNGLTRTIGLGGCSELSTVQSSVSVFPTTSISVSKKTKPTFF